MHHLKEVEIVSCGQETFWRSHVKTVWHADNLSGHLARPSSVLFMFVNSCYAFLCIYRMCSDKLYCFFYIRILYKLQVKIFVSSKCPPFSRRHFQLNFIEQRLLIFKQKFTAICSLWSNWQWPNNVADNESVPRWVKQILYMQYLPYITFTFYLTLFHYWIQNETYLKRKRQNVWKSEATISYHKFLI